MVGFTESLNISVAAAIILENLTTRLRNSRVDWKLSEEEMLMLYHEWIQKSIKNVDKIIAAVHNIPQKIKNKKVFFISFIANRARIGMKKILRHVIEFGMFILLSILNVTPLITSHTII